MTPKKAPVRLMAPFSMQCIQCEHFIYKNTKFHSRKSSTSESYLGIPIVQFSMRCSNCSNEIVFRTDPKTSGYILLSGANRNLDPHRDQVAEQETMEAKLVRLRRQSEESTSVLKTVPIIEKDPAIREEIKERKNELGVKKKLPIPKRRKHVAMLKSGKSD